MARLAFADVLKNDIDHFLQKNLGISAFTKDDDQKRVIRPILVAYGEAMRRIDMDHWVKKIEPTADSLLTLGADVCITDVRYENEAKWISSNGFVVNITREDILPPNDSEIKNARVVKKIADLVVEWPEIANEKDRRLKAMEIYKKVTNAYNDKFGLGPRFERKD